MDNNANSMRSQMGLAPVAVATPIDRSKDPNSLTGNDAINYLNSVAPQPATSAPSIGSEISDQASGGLNQVETAGSDLFSGKGDAVKNEMNVLGGVGSILSSPLAPLFKPLGDAIAKSAAGGDNGQNAGLLGSIMNSINNNPDYQKFAMSQTGQATSDMMQNESNAANFTGTVAGGAEAGVNLADNMPKIIAAGKNVIGAVSDAASTAGGAVSDLVKGAKEFVSPTLTPDEEVGQIIKGKLKDIAPAQRTFAELPSDVGDVTKMKPTDLSTAIQTKIIKPNLDAVDTAFSKDTTPYKMSEFDETTGTGANTVKINYVQQAIEQLKKFYIATKDATGLSDISALKEKANTEGLTPKEVNDLAKTHGTAINGFNANGEAAGGVTKQAAENIRTGVKTTARAMLAETDPDAAAEVAKLDKQTSEAIKTKNLIDKRIQKESTSVQNNGKQSGLSSLIQKHPIIKAGVQAAGLGAGLKFLP